MPREANACPQPFKLSANEYEERYVLLDCVPRVLCIIVSDSPGICERPNMLSPQTRLGWRGSTKIHLLEARIFHFHARKNASSKNRYNLRIAAPDSLTDLGIAFE